MAYLLEDLVIDRVDLVDEGANSVAFITLFKRKEQNMGITEIIAKMTPEHAKVVTDTIEALTKSKETLDTEHETVVQDLAKAQETLVTVNAELDLLKKSKDEPGTEEDIIKSLPEDVKKYVQTLRTQKEAAEEAILKAKETEENAVAIAKASELKSLPVEQSKLVDILKSASPELVEVLTTISAALNDTILGEVGKKHTLTGTSTDAWGKIEAKAEEIAKSEKITKAKAITKVVNENPDLYKEYLEGGAN